MIGSGASGGSLEDEVSLSGGRGLKEGLGKAKRSGRALCWRLRSRG